MCTLLVLFLFYCVLPCASLIVVGSSNRLVVLTDVLVTVVIVDKGCCALPHVSIVVVCSFHNYTVVGAKLSYLIVVLAVVLSVLVNPVLWTKAVVHFFVLVLLW